jgi:hypothetical protein
LKALGYEVRAAAARMAANSARVIVAI